MLDFPSLKLHRHSVSRQDAFTLSVHIEVGEGQDLEQALLALRQRVQREYGRPWYKRRYGYYESRSALRRKRKRSKQRQTSRPSFYIGQRELFARTGPTTTTGK